MDLGIRGKRALITGGSRGLGRQSALALANEGVDVAICARGKETLDATVGEISNIGVNAVGYALDMGDADAPAQAVEQMKADLGEPDIVVNNVGGSMGTSDVINSSVEDFAMVTDLNLFSAIRLIKLTLPGMQERGWGTHHQYLQHLRSRGWWNSPLHGGESGDDRSFETCRALKRTDRCDRQLCSPGIDSVPGRNLGTVPRDKYLGICQ